MIKIVVDAMGGDNAPAAQVQGAIEAVNERKDIQVILVGKEDVIKNELTKYNYNSEQISIVHAGEVIETSEPPVNAIRRKKVTSCSCWSTVKADIPCSICWAAGNSGVTNSLSEREY